MDYVAIVISLVVLVVQLALVIWGRRQCQAAYRSIRAIRLGLESVDEPPLLLGPIPHDHVWGDKAIAEDETSVTRRCQVPRCPKTHTEMRG